MGNRTVVHDPDTQGVSIGDDGSRADVARRAHALIARFFEYPVADMGGGLKIVSLPQQWMDVRDVDIIKRALDNLARQNS
jgi:hypothetical protein